MSFLAELLAIVVVWLSSIALGQLGVAIDQSPRANSAQGRTVSPVRFEITGPWPPFDFVQMRLGA